jgi:catecholate siderophore receptor
MIGGFYLNSDNGVNYGIPWLRQDPGSSSTASNGLWPGAKPDAYYGLASDYNAGLAKIATASHLHRFGDGTELRTVVRRGSFDRDLRPSAIRFQNPSATDISNFGPGTVLTRSSNNSKIQGFDTTAAQSDLSTKFEAWGYQHEVQAGVDFSREEKSVYAASAVTKPTTTVGTPDDGLAIDESARTLGNTSAFVSKGWGAYAQDMVHLTPTWKLVGGLRYDNLHGDYKLFTTNTAFQQTVAKWSERVGVLYQPDAFRSFHFSYGTSFNTSGDTYSYSAANVNVPPEESRNIELGARLESQDKRLSTRMAIFHSTKLHERNTDPETAPDLGVLSGKRHTAGFEIDLVGRITPEWEVFGSYMWLPIARVDQTSAASAGNRVGDRPGLTPRHSGTIWSTYQLTPKWRVGAGLNFRSRQSPPDITTARWEAPGFVTADLLAEYTINDRFTVKGNVSNVTNKYYAESLYRAHYLPGAGRLLQVSLITRF